MLLPRRLDACDCCSSFLNFSLDVGCMQSKIFTRFPSLGSTGTLLKDCVALTRKMKILENEVGGYTDS